MATSTALNWKPITAYEPKPGTVVLTRINDSEGTRNEQRLKRSSGRLWFMPDGSMYVYYTPTEYVPEAQQ